MTDRIRDDEDQRGGTPIIGPGFPAFQLAKALINSVRHADPAVRERAAERASSWKQILDHLMEQSVDYGSRTPINNVPAWATLDVMTGGYATGKLTAGGPLERYELDLLEQLQGSARTANRLTLNTYFLTDTGLAKLQDLLRSSHYEIRFPEEGALLTVAWLVCAGHSEAAAAILDEIAPYFSHLRFYPVPTYRARHHGPRVHVENIGAVRKQFAAMRPHKRVVAQKMAVEKWAPLHDRTLSLFAETVGDDLWPCQKRPANWSTRANALLVEYRALDADSDVPSKYRKAGSHYTQLREFLRRSTMSFEPLTGRDVGRIRHILRCSFEKRGEPSTFSSREYRRRQSEEVKGPLHKDIARIVEQRLAEFAPEEGLDNIATLQQPVTAEEGKTTVPAGTPVPQHVARKLERCMNESLDLLARRGVVPSGEILATVLPQLTSGLRALSIDDPALRGLYAAVYRAFRRRRSLLLLNLQSQVRIEELPWVAAIDRMRSDDLSSRAAARQALEATVLLSLEFFSRAILPNKLVRELGALATGAGIDIPLVEELAADIFIGEFSPKFVEAAKVAGSMLSSSLYSTYYGIDYDAIAGIAEIPRPASAPSWPQRDKRATVSAFAELCAARAGVTLGTWRPAINGMIIEQQQILTTQNLAALVVRLDLRERINLRAYEMARSCFKWICARNQMPAPDWHGELIRVKNSAYAWRQMIFFLSLASTGEVGQFLDWAEDVQTRQSPTWQQRFRPAIEGLKGAAHGIAPETVFLGWSDSKHWLMG